MSNEPQFPITPLSQLNLMLWLTWYPLDYEHSGIRPVFRAMGFTVLAIGPRITLAPDKELRLRQSSTLTLPKGLTASPDILITNTEQHYALSLECKLSSFGPTSSTAAQTTLLLATDGRALAQSFGLAEPSNNWTNGVLYVLPDAEHTAILPTLHAISQELEVVAVVPAAFGSTGIAVNDEAVYLQFLTDDSRIESLLEVGGLQTNDWTPVVNLSVTGDYRLLQLIPIDPSIDNSPENWLVFERKLRATLVSLIGSRLDEDTWVVTEREIMQGAIEVWDFWQDSNAKTSLRRDIRKYIRKMLHDVEQKTGIKLSYNGDSTNKAISLSVCTETIADKLRAYFVSSAFRQDPVDRPSQTTIFDVWDDE